MDTLTDKQKRAIPIILANPKHKEAIKESGINKSTFYTWLQDEGFKSEINRQRDEITQHALNTLKDTSTRAVETLTSLLGNDSPTIQLRASLAIIDFTIKAQELDNLEKRLAFIENLVRENKLIRR